MLMLCSPETHTSANPCLQILATAGQAALYCFNTDTNEWVKRDTEGTFFVVENRSIPHLQIVVLNQKGGPFPQHTARGLFRIVAG